VRTIDLSHPISDGLVTYPGLPGPSISDHLSREGSRGRYAEGTEFQIGRIDMIANTGTYLDTPFHRFADGWDLAALDLAKVAGVPGLVLDGPPTGPTDLDALGGREVAGRAVLVRTGWSVRFGTEAYGDPDHPHLSTALADALVAGGASLVGIDSVNIDATTTGERPVHTTLLRAGIPIVEHLRGLEQLGDEPFAFTAVPPAVRGMGTFPVRAFATVDRRRGPGAAV
jgi:kynurenine formamidase